MKPRKFNPNARRQKFDTKKKQQQQQEISNTPPNQKFKGRVPVRKDALAKHDRGTGIELEKVKTFTRRKKLESKEKIIQFSAEHAARTEILLTEDAG